MQYPDAASTEVSITVRVRHGVVRVLTTKRASDLRAGVVDSLRTGTGIERNARVGTSLAKRAAENMARRRRTLRAGRVRRRARRERATRLRLTRSFPLASARKALMVGSRAAGREDIHETKRECFCRKRRTERAWSVTEVCIGIVVKFSGVYQTSSGDSLSVAHPTSKNVGGRITCDHEQPMDCIAGLHPIMLSIHCIDSMYERVVVV